MERRRGHLGKVGDPRAAARPRRSELLHTNTGSVRQPRSDAQPCRPDGSGSVTARTEPAQQSVLVTRRYAVQQSDESAVVIGVREYERLAERLDACKAGGWGELWLAGAGAGVAVAAAALVTALSLPANLIGISDVLWTATVAGAVVTALCLFGYFSQRRDHGKEINELKKDLEMHKPTAGG